MKGTELKETHLKFTPMEKFLIDFSKKRHFEIDLEAYLKKFPLVEENYSKIRSLFGDILNKKPLKLKENDEIVLLHLALRSDHLLERINRKDNELHYMTKAYVSL